MSSSYAALQLEHPSLPAFQPFLSPSSLQPLSILFLAIAFVLTFYFSTLRSKSTLPVSELAVGGLASVFGGFGLVFAFCAIGANV
ncbi:hypothetical protein NBRC10512_000712 [Rhodotorula toruloides]|uniref:Dolichyl-diphosphooligosaccharide-protein glycosyltransferase subunit OST5 n=2 Tax=Rhodotorula toruloides TaxID=5286 RepID=A0A061BR23_RHOTO|nr:uncharacterized protein RHTO_07965 [Rhodotorula toruloides NP11]EMS22612.1 hypothetical protein RHTO_07965 [Rhodotorula toruloides NP11]CDR49495.1 RHTO0S27e00870g1_1 [Rhodotorula toruloides]